MVLLPLVCQRIDIPVIAAGGGDMEASLPQLGAVAGRIREVLPAAEIIRRTVEEFTAVVHGLAGRYPR